MDRRRPMERADVRFQQHIDERAALEVFLAEPDEDIEDRQKPR
jgi:hypothetical protein